MSAGKSNDIKNTFTSAGKSTAKNLYAKDAEEEVRRVSMDSYCFGKPNGNDLSKQAIRRKDDMNNSHDGVPNTPKK